MKILREQDLNKSNTLEGIKDLMLYKVMLFSCIIGVPVVLYNIYFSIESKLTVSGLINLLLFSPIIIVVFFYRKTPYKIRARVLIHSATLMALFNFYLAGYAGAAYIILLSVISFSAAFFNKKEAVIQIIICIIIAIVSAIFYITGTWQHIGDFELLITSPSSWIVSIALFSFLSFMFYAAYNIIQDKLTQKIVEEQKNNTILEESNNKLQELLVQQANHQNELLKAKLKAEESNNLKTEFLHNMSHEVRTPLNGIMGFSKLIQKEGLSDEKRKQFSDIIIHSSEKLQRVIDDILEISFLETKQISVSDKEFNVYDFLQDLYQVFLVDSKTEVDIEMTCKDKDLTIVSDLHKIHKILSNLIENALKFTDYGIVEFGCICAEKNKIRFFVKDTGIGISNENIDKIFSRFTQEHDNISTKYGGLGLGLCIAK